MREEPHDSHGFVLDHGEATPFNKRAQTWEGRDQSGRGIQEFHCSCVQFEIPVGLLEMLE